MIHSAESPNCVGTPVRSRRIRHGAPVSQSDLQQFRRLITKDEWRATVLPARLKKEWEDESGLYQVIKAALRFGFAADVEAASMRLIEIDSNHERSHVTRGIVLMRMQRFKEAQKALREHADVFGPTRIVLTCLAKAYDEAGDSGKSTKTLLKALSLPQWSDASLSWWSEIQRDLGGETAHVEILQRAAAIRGSWVPSLWHARHSLRANDIKRALSGYKQAIIGTDADADVLAVIANDLVKHALFGEVIELLKSIYEPARHGPLAGLNLLRAYLAVSDAAQGGLLLDDMRKHFNEDLRNHLDHYARQMGRVVAGLPVDAALEPGGEDRELFVLDGGDLGGLKEEAAEPAKDEASAQAEATGVRDSVQPEPDDEVSGVPRLLTPCLWLTKSRN